MGIQPVSREELQKLLVTDADPYSALRFLRKREEIPALQNIEKAGEVKLPGAVGALADLYYALWAENPSVREEVRADRRYFAEILKGSMATSAYEEIHAATALSELRSVLGTISMGNTIVGNISKEDAEKLAESKEAEDQAEEAEAEATQAEADADALQQLADEANSQNQQDEDGEQGEAGDDQGQSAQGQSPSEPQAGQGEAGQQSGQPSSAGGQPQQGKKSSGASNQSGGELSKAAADARAKAEAARAEANAARELADEAAETLLGKPGSEAAAEKLKDLARQGIAAARDAKSKVEEVSDILQSWGLEEAELTQQGIPEALAILERVRKNPAFKDFAKILGRIKRMAAKKAASKDQADGVRVTRIETGRDIKRAVTSELVALTHPALRTQALTRWARGELRLRGEETKKKKGEGPVIVCEDSSGSMSGAKEQWAKAVVLAMAHYAKLRNRSFAWIMFDSSVQRSRMFVRGKLSARDLLDIAESRSGGGTLFEPPLTEALRYIREGGLRKADIAFITDGDSALSPEFLAEFMATKERLEVNVFAVLCDMGHTSDATVKQFADRIIHASSFSGDEAAEVINCL